MLKALLVGIGGFLGAMSRYAIDSWTSSIFGRTFPIGTMAVNISGSFLLGFVLAAFLGKVTQNHNLSLLVATGFIGAYTTYSTFMLDSAKLAESGALNMAILNITVSLVFGLAAVYLGLSLGRSIA